MKKRGFLEGYKTYDTSQGFGNPDHWREAFRSRMSREDAEQVLSGEADTPYQILGVSPEASQAEIKAGFRRLILEWHPDKNPHRLDESEAMSKKINAANSLLSK